MLPISISGFADLNITDVIFDYNGTLAIAGDLIPGVDEHIHLSRKAQG